MIEPIVKHRCSLAQMPSDISWNAAAQIPYLNQQFDLVRAEAEEAGFEIEHWDGDSKDPHALIHTLQARGPNVLIIASRGGLVKKLGDGAWVPDSAS